MSFRMNAQRNKEWMMKTVAGEDTSHGEIKKPRKLFAFVVIKTVSPFFISGA